MSRATNAPASRERRRKRLKLARVTSAGENFSATQPKRSIAPLRYAYAHRKRKIPISALSGSRASARLEEVRPYVFQVHRRPGQGQLSSWTEGFVQSGRLRSRHFRAVSSISPRSSLPEESGQRS